MIGILDSSAEQIDQGRVEEWLSGGSNEDQGIG